MPSIRLTTTQRQALLEYYRRAADPGIGCRARILLRLDAGHPWATLSAVLFCSFATISRWKRRFEAEGVATVDLGGREGGRRADRVENWAEHSR
jgi:hypothetical protein